MGKTFYPFVESDGEPDATPELAPPTSAARIAVYDTMTMAPRVEIVEPNDIRSYLDEITKTVFELASQQGGDWSFMVIRELVENFIHASFSEPSISILDKGQTLVFSDQGPGIPNKPAALKPSFSSASKAMKRYIRGVGSGLPIVEEQLRLRNGTLTIEDNLGHGTIVTVSLVPAKQPEAPQGGAAAPAQTQQGMPYGYGSGGAPANPYGQPQPNQPAMAQAPMPGYPNPAMPAPAPYPGAPTGYGYPAGYPPAQPYGAQPNPAYYSPYGAQPAYGNPYGQAAYAPPGQPAYDAQLAAAYGAAPQGYGSPYPYGQQPGTSPAAGPQTPDQQPFPYPLRAAPEAEPLPAAPQETAAQAAHVPLTERQRDALQLFAHAEQVGVKDLAGSLDVSQPTASRCLGGLAQAGYVIKNGQKYMLTGEGQRVLAHLMNSEE